MSKKKIINIKNISIVVPCLNEEKNLWGLSAEIKKNFKGLSYEVIFVDDNSTDNSEKILKKIIKKSKNFKAILLKTYKRDLSKSVIIGTKKAKSNLIAVMDADLQHRPKDLKKMYLYFKKKNIDVLVGCRNLNFKNNFKKLSFIRLMFSKTLIFFINIFIGKKTSDPMSGFFIYKKNLMNYKKNFFAKGFKILLDIIYASKNNIIIEDFKIYFQRRNAEHSKISTKILLHLLISIIKKIKFLNLFKIRTL